MYWRCYDALGPSVEPFIKVQAMNQQQDLNALFIDQRVQGILQKYPDFFPVAKAQDESWKRSAAFVILTAQCVLDCSLEAAAECLTDGANDFAVDAIYIGDVDDGEFEVVLFQGKYKQTLTGDAAFPATGLQQLVDSVKVLFDPFVSITLNERLRPKVEEIRSMVRDGLIPHVKVVLCNNGQKWNREGEDIIRQANFPQDQVEFIHFNHNRIVEVLRKTKPINASLELRGAAIVEDFNFKRVLIGRLPVVQIADIFQKYDVQLLERNVRRYLGLHSNRVNSAISQTLLSSERRGDFYFLNNGITIVCNKFTYNALQRENFTVHLEGMQIINGGQTCKTIELTLQEHPELASQLDQVDVLIRLYELPSDSEAFVKAITYATNSQNPVDLRDLHANDEVQKTLALGMKELGVTYRHKRDESGSDASGTVFQSSITAEAVLAIWRHCPHQAKFMRKELFGKLYNLVFNHLNAAQAIMANQIFRFVENERKRPTILTKDFLPYSAHYVAMRLGCLLLKSAGITLTSLTHQTYAKACSLFDSQKVELYKQAVNDVESVLKVFYGERTNLSLQQLSATFRRGDLIEKLLV